MKTITCTRQGQVRLGICFNASAIVAVVEQRDASAVVIDRNGKEWSVIEPYSAVSVALYNALLVEDTP